MTIYIASGTPSHSYEEHYSTPASLLRSATPHIVADIEDLQTFIGVALTVEETDGTVHGERWGHSHKLLQSWRAMKLLEVTPNADFDALCPSWYSMAAQIDEFHKPHMHQIAEYFPTYEDFFTVRDAISNIIPNEAELSEMLDIVHVHNIELIDLKEIQEIVDRGAYLDSRLLLDDLLQRQREKIEHQQQEREAAIANAIGWSDRPSEPQKRGFFSTLNPFNLFY